MMYTATEKERKTSGKNTKFGSMCENLVNFEKKNSLGTYLLTRL